jgi:ADP-heptose:LPS heptosyltransferase
LKTSALEPEGIRRILVLRPRALGDVLLITPALRALRAQFAAARIDVGVDDTVAPILDRNPHVTHRWLFPRKRPRHNRRWLPIYAGIQRAGYQMVIDLHGSARTAMLTLLSGARTRVGYPLRGRRHAYNVLIPRDSDRHGRRCMIYAAQTNLEFVARCGVHGAALDDASLVYTPNPDPAMQTAMRQLVGESSRGWRVALAPAGTWPAKTADPQVFADLAQRLTTAGCQVLLVWGPGEEGVCRNIWEACGRQVTLAPPTTLDELAIILQNVDLLISHDSGIKHLAVALATATLTLFGPTEPRAWMPTEGPHDFVRANIPCLGCNLTECSHRSCMQLLTGALLSQRALALLERLQQRRQP